MNLKIKAGLNTLGFFLSMFGASYILAYLATTMSKAQITVAIVSVVMAFFVYIIYSINLSQLEYKAKLEEITNKE